VSEGKWPIVSLGELIDCIEAGSSFRCRETPPEANEVGVAKVSAVSWGYYNEMESKTCLVPSRIDKRLLIQKGDFLISRANTVQLVGACVIAERVTKRVMLSDKTLRIRFKDPSLKSWVLHFLRSREGRNQMEMLCTGNQDSMRNISQKRLQQIEVPLAPPEEREQIIADLDLQLSRLSDASATFSHIQAKLKQARASILKAAVEGRLVEMTTNNKQGLAMLAVSEICSIKPTNGRSVPTRDGGFPVLRLTAMKDGRIDFSQTKGGAWSEEEAAKWIIEEGDFFVMRGNGSIKRVGDGAIAKQVPYKVAYPDTMIRIRTDTERCDGRYLLHLWRSPLVRLQIQAAAKTTAGIFKISQRDIASFRLPIPALSEQREIVAEVDRRFSVLDQVEATVQASLARCGILRQAILKRAFEGRLVPAT
jgi:type I restriction enzyme S subunit